MGVMVSLMGMRRVKVMVMRDEIVMTVKEMVLVVMTAAVMLDVMEMRR